METVPVAARISLNNILLTTDFSQVSQGALPYAAALARWYGAKIFVVHIVPLEPILSVPLDPIPLQLDEAWDAAQHRLADFLPAGSLADIAHEEILRRGELWTVLSDMIRQKQVDLLVMGTHGRQGLKKLMLGSDAEKIYRQATCPVLTVGPEAASAAGKTWAPKKILFPTDFSETSLHALPYALSLAEENDATLTLAHMVPLIPWQHKEAVEESTRKRLEALAPAVPWCRFEFVVDFDFPAEAILRVAQERGAELIVMGVRKPAAVGWSAHVPWSTASHVVSAAPCPVLTVRG